MTRQRRSAIRERGCEEKRERNEVEGGRHKRGASGREAKMATWGGARLWSGEKVKSEGPNLVVRREEGRQEAIQRERGLDGCNVLSWGLMRHDIALNV